MIRADLSSTAAQGQFARHDELALENPARGRVLAVLRLACRVLGMNKRGIGRLCGGAIVTALLLSMGIGAMPAVAQTVQIGGGTVTGTGATAVNPGAIAIGANATGGASALAADSIAIGGQDRKSVV